ncbi:hypothetical protein VTO42DRAFT_253 [Malbranchea cinnamomea]
MVAAASSRGGKPPKPQKGGTATTKSHRFEGFSQRVARLKIDPVHRVRRNSFSEDNGDDTSSYFRTSLEHWAELNLSENFTEFCQRVGRLCESLPQILYHQDEIMSLLIEYISKKDELCMEPLLSLVAQFARDLGPRFEKHFAAAVQLVASVAATHPNIEVIEWSFTCLAWIFKFLSRLLVPDLRKLLGIMTPYLGKEKQKYFVTRFAAESMSFLVRKAAMVYYKDRAPLERAIGFLFEDIASISDARHLGMYQDGLMTMFSEAVKGVKGGVHSNGPDILRCMIDAATVEDETRRTIAEDIISGVLISLVHHCNADSFAPILYLVCEYIERPETSASDACRRLQSRLILLCVATRKGSRVRDWQRVHKSLLLLLERASSEGSDWSSPAIDNLLGAVAVAIQTSPMDDLLPHMRQMMELVTHGQLARYFIPFCSLFTTFGSDRFQSVVLTYFQRYIISFWNDYEDALCVILPKLEGNCGITSDLNRSGTVICPNAWKEQIAKRFCEPDPTINDVAFLHAYLKLRRSISLSAQPSLLPQLENALRDHIQGCLQKKSTRNESLNTFIRGQGLLAYIQLAAQSKKLHPSLWITLCEIGPNCANIPVFLQATLEYLYASPELPDCSEGALEPFATSLLHNLSGPSHQVRLLSLKILENLVQRVGADASCISIAINVERSELSLQTARTLSMEIRRLGMSYSKIVSHKWLSRLIPDFCFGLLTKKLASVWDDACNAFKLICEDRVGEQTVSELAMRWLLNPGNPVTDDSDEPEENASRADVSSDFECFNVLNVENAISSSLALVQSAESTLIQDFEKTHLPVAEIPANARSQALRVFNAVPHVAEKKSRQLVPLFLEWASQDDEFPVPVGSNNADEKSPRGTAVHDGKVGWNLRDKKDMLSLFGKFVNPKALYKASEAHEALAGLLCNGDSEVQKLALKAVLTWKLPFMIPYEENLMNIVDDARFRDELAVFVHVGRENSIIKEAHRQDLLPYLLKLLYGKVVARAGSKGALGTQEARRKAILRTISELPEEDFNTFLLISYGVLSDVRVLKDSAADNDCLSHEFISLRKQYGMLRMIETMFSILKTKMTPYADRSMNVVLYCLIRACRRIGDSDAASSSEAAANVSITLLRTVRTLGIRCLELVFSASPNVDWTPYIGIIFTEIINPRLDNFAVETAQGISGLLQLFRTWASHPRSALYFRDDSVVFRIVQCLEVESARDEVKLFVIDEVINGLIKSASIPETDKEGDIDMELVEIVRSRVLAPHLEYMLTRLESLLRSQPSRQLTISAVEVLSKLAAFVESSGETTRLVSTAIYLLQQGPDRVPPKTKGGLLRVLQHFLPLYDPQGNDGLNQQIFEVLSSLFDYFKDNTNRQILSVVFSSFANIEVGLKDVAQLCADLNSLSSTKLDEVDFERRLAAFHTINEEQFKKFTARQWQPLIYNMLYHVKDVEELAIRTSASLGLKRFVQIAALRLESGETGSEDLLNKILLPALRSGMKQNAEIVRVEFVGILGDLIQHHRSLPSVQDMYDLLANGDEEASFFNNILHIQQHRRLRALRRLAAEVAKGKIKASNISSLFFPLIEHYVFNQAEDENAHNLTAETVSTIGALSQGLEWSQFRAIFRRYKDYIKSKPGMEKNVIRLLGQMSDALSRAIAAQELTTAPTEEAIEGIETATSQSTLSKSVNKTQVGSELKTNFIPFFTEFIHHKEESEVSLRLPLAVTTVKLLKLLPEQEMSLLLPPVLLDIANILKSKSQDSRDVARRTLGDIALILGPSYFGYILKELRATLTKGYQLHVLSFTVHSILVATSDDFQIGDLDQDLGELATVVMDDIFGTVGQEKDAEDYVSKMKEVKSSKSYDSMELLAKNASIHHLSKLIRPIQRLLQERLTSSIVKKVDDLLRRIGSGILRNPGAESRDLLIFCYEVIKESYNTEKPISQETRDQRQDRFLVNLIGQKKSGTGRSTSSYLYKLARFSLDVLRSILNKYNSLQTPQNLHGFLPVIGDALVQGYEEVKLSAIRLLATIIKLPLEDLDKNADVYLVEAIKLIREAPSTNTEAAQASLKFIASILRERRSTKIKDSYLAYLLKRISGDIEDPDRQGVTFNFIRAVMARKFIVPEMYELVDNIAAMMVTNQTRSARDLARGVYVHFLIEYPQAKSRWTKQLGFMAKNLDYQYKEGRQSVMEAVHLLLSKTGGELAQDIVSTFFVPIIMAMANDESAECRDMAGVLLGNIYSRADTENLKSILSMLRTWVEQEENPVLTVTGLQAMKIFFESDVTSKESEVRFVTKQLPRLLAITAERQDDSEWQILFQSLQLLSKLSKLFPALILTTQCQGIWSKVQANLRYSHPWIKSCAANLVGTWLADEAKANAANGYGSVPLSGSYGLKLNEDAMLDITQASLSCLKLPTVSEDLATQAVRNIVFLARCFAQNHLSFVQMKPGERVNDETSDESEIEDSPGDTPSDSSKANKPAIQYIFEQAAIIIRREPLTTRAESLTAKTACMKLVAALCNHLETAQILPSLQTLLLPLLHLTDPSIPPPRSSDESFEATYKGLIQSSQEILDLLQKKLGTTDFVRQISQARDKMKARREERRVKRRIEAVADPEKFNLEKKRKHERKKEKRKERSQEFRGKRRGW